MGTTLDRIERNRSLVLWFYESAKRGDMRDVATFMHPGFTCSAPRYLPWGEILQGSGVYLNTVLPQVGALLDFGPFSYDSLTVGADHAVALINVGIRGTAHRVRISEHSDFEAG